MKFVKSLCFSVAVCLCFLSSATADSSSIIQKAIAQYLAFEGRAPQGISFRELTHDEIGSLEYLNLSGNSLELSENSFSGLTGLKRLDLSFCHLKQLHRNLFSELPNLEELKLHGNDLSDLDPVKRALARIPNLVSVTLNGNSFQRDQIPGLIRFARRKAIQSVTIESREVRYPFLRYFRSRSLHEPHRPEIDSLPELFFPEEANPEVGFTLNDCRGRYRHTLLHVNGKLLDECKPDTIYSWGSRRKLEYLKEKMGNGDWEDEFRMLYTTRHPMITFGYGEVPIRMKLRKDLRWVPGKPRCDRLSSEESENTIFYSRTGLLEFFLCSPLTIASWSYGKARLYDEIVKEYRWLATPGRDYENDVETYGTQTRSLEEFFHQNWDKLDFSKPTFFRYLNSLYEMVVHEEGAVYYHPGLYPELRNEYRHFETVTPIYYNED